MFTTYAKKITYFMASVFTKHRNDTTKHVSRSATQCYQLERSVSRAYCGNDDDVSALPCGQFKTESEKEKICYIRKYFSVTASYKKKKYKKNHRFYYNNTIILS